MAVLYPLARLHTDRQAHGDLYRGMADQILLLIGGIRSYHAGVGEGFGREEADAIPLLQHLLYGLFPAIDPIAGTYQGALLLLLIQRPMEPEEDIRPGTD